MYQQRVAFRDDGDNMIHQDVLEQRGADGHHVRITTTERLPNTMDTPRYPNLGCFFDDNNNNNKNAYEGIYGDDYDNYANARRTQTENVFVKKHHPVAENVHVQRQHAQYGPAMEKVLANKHHPQYEPFKERVLANKHYAQYEPVPENVFVQQHHAQYGPAMENVLGNKHHPQYEPGTQSVLVKKHYAQYESVNGGKQQTYEEDVNMGADDFIKRKHQALDLA